MHKRPILLVLGAGASFPYKFPLGRRLLFETASELLSTSDLQRCLQQMDFNIGDLHSFARELQSSQLPSIDVFLSFRPEFSELGRSAMAGRLIIHESDNALVRQPDLEWYEYVFSRVVTKDPEMFPSQDIAVVTFNYDRSFERYLDLALGSCYGVRLDEAVALRKRIPIHHVYGDLGALSEPECDCCRAYEPTVTTHTIAIASRRIRLLGEERSDNDELHAVRQLVEDAFVIAFMGFAFHPQNVEVLGVADPRSQKSFFANAWSPTINERNRLNGLFDSRLNLHEGSCLSLLQTYNVVG